MEPKVDSFFLLFFFVFGVSFLGSLVACCPCFLSKPYDMRLRLGVIWIVVVWTSSCVSWFAFSPLSACTPRVVYSYPRLAYFGEAYWCSYPCKTEILRPSSVEEVRSSVVMLKKVRVIGAGHSPSDLQCADEGEGSSLLSTENLCFFDDGRLLSHGEASFGSGCRVSWAQGKLLGLGYQLNGFGGIASQRMGGAISTSLHGQHTVPFSNNLVSLTSILANGTQLRIGRGDPDFMAWPGSMGMLGVVVEVTLSVFPIQTARCVSYEGGEEEFSSLLEEREVVGFEARRLLRGEGEETYVLRRCEEVEGDSPPFAQYESKDSLVAGFAIDHLGLGSLFLMGRSVVSTRFFTSTLFSLAEVGSSREGEVLTANDFRVRVSFNPHFDEEYSVPLRECHSALTEIGSLIDLPVHAYVRRVDGAEGYLSWSPSPSCTIRLEYFDFGRADFLSYEREFRTGVERIVLSKGGSGHFGKPWYSNASLLLQNSPRREAFFSYRERVDPLQKFQNSFTLKMWREESTKRRAVLPPLLETRATVWRTITWVSIVSTLVSSVLFCVTAFPTRVKTNPDPPTYAVVVKGSAIKREGEQRRRRV